jgi:AcrR family transcriptional regulator
MNTPVRPRGRPRAFDKNDALDGALKVFWRRGYAGASLTELTAATGLAKPSLYAAFGDKQALYLQALQRYAEMQLPRHVAVLERERDGRKAVERFLRSMAAMYTDPELPGGCLALSSATECGSATLPAPVDAALKGTVAQIETLLHARIERAQREGQLPRSARTAELAALFAALLPGLNQAARAGARRSRLDRIIATAMDAWPVSPPTD